MLFYLSLYIAYSLEDRGIGLMKLQQVNTPKGKVWEVNGYLMNDDQKVRVKKRGFANKRRAQQWFNNESVLFYNGESKYNKKERPTVLTVKALYDIWIDAYQRTVEESTLRKTMNLFALHILPDWGDVLVSDIKPIQLQLYVNTLQSKLLRYRVVINSFRRLLSLALKMDMIAVDPFTKIDLPKERRRLDKPKQFMDIDEFKRFIDVLDSQYRLINKQAYTLLRLGAFTGMRTEELLALQWQSVDFDNGYISVVQALGRGLNGGTYVKEPKSRTSRRTLKIDNKMLAVLSEWYEYTAYKEINDYVFNHEGHTLQILRPNKWLHDVSNKYNVAVGLSMHKLRHTWATLALDRGATVKQVQTYLGHADASITLNVYSDITKRASDEAGSILSGIIG